MEISTSDLKKILVDSGYVTEIDFNKAVISAYELKKSVSDILIFRGLITSDALSKLTSEYYKVPFIDLKYETIDDAILAYVPEKMAQTYRMIPIKKTQEELFLAMENPINIEAIEFAKRHTGLNIIPLFTTKESLSRALNQYKRHLKEDFQKIVNENLSDAQNEGDLSRAAEKIPVIKILDTLFEYAISQRASDIHIETMENSVVIRFRIDGSLQDIVSLPRGVEESLIARIKILSKLKLDERRIPQDGRYKFELGGERVSLRISIIPSFYGENVVARLLLETERPRSLEELGVFANNLNSIKESIQKPHGMILVTGPTGSGKTTTLYSILNILNEIDVKICTIEDPIEYGVDRITQIQVNQKTGMTFAAGLRALLRHDPDIIMVGEIRDEETAQIAVNAALTGHLVLSTLHTNDAISSLPRLLDMGIEEYLVSSTVNVIIAQRLVKRLDSKYSIEYRPNQEILDHIKRRFGANPDNMKFYKPKENLENGTSGYAGRVGIYEVVNLTQNLRELIINKASIDEILVEAKKEGMTTMIEDGLNKVSSGITTIEEVIKAVSEE